LNWTLDFWHDTAIWWIIRHVILLSGPLAVWLFLWFLIWGYLTFGQRWWIRIVNCLLRQLLLGLWLVTATRRRGGFGAFPLFGHTCILHIHTHTHTHTHSHTHKGKTALNEHKIINLHRRWIRKSRQNWWPSCFFPSFLWWLAVVEKNSSGTKSVSTTIAVLL